MLQRKIVITPQRDAETLVVALNRLFLSASRTETFALARENRIPVGSLQHGEGR
jgi:hypothetical protein